MPLFVGEFDQTIDAKRRLSIPAPLREDLDEDEYAGSFYLVVGSDDYLWLYPDKYYRRLVKMIKRSPLPAPQAQGIDALFAMARVVKPDAQGRIVLPPKSMERSEISDCVTLVGGGDHIVIWPHDRWEAQIQATRPIYGQLLAEAAERLDANANGE